MDGFKQRLIGALVLISLAVIFLPMLLDEPHEERTLHTIEIPEEPDFPEVRVEPEPEPQIDDPIEPVPEPQSPPIRTTGSAGSPTEPFNGNETVEPAQPGQSAGESAPQPRGDADQGREVTTPETASQGPAVREPAAPEPAEPSSSEPREAPQPEPATEQPTQAAAPESGGFLVQLGSFGNAANARGLRSSVEETGFQAYTREVSSNDATLTRVYAGPFPNKEAATAAKQKIDQEFGLNTLVIVND